MKPQTKRVIKSFLAPFHRIGLRNTDFSIISNNCWGGFYYDRFHLPYRTPTIGLFIPPKDYIKFLNNMEYYLSVDVEPVLFEDSNYADMLLRKEEKGYLSNVRDMIIGKIDDIEIMFLHYSSFDEARKKWNKRKSRINFNNLIVKFNDQNEFSIEDYYAFRKLQFRNKLFFTSNPNLKYEQDVFYIKKYEKVGFALDDMHCGFDIKEYLNSLLVAENKGMK